MNKGYVFSITLIFLLLITLFSVHGQNIDLSKAVISVAGPQSFYVRNAAIDGQNYSFTVKADSSQGTSWSIIKVYPSSSNIVPGDVVLDFASGRINEAGNAVIEGVVVGETFYSVSLDISQDDVIKVLTVARQDDVKLKDLNRTDVLEAMFEAFYQKAYEEEIAEKEKSITGLKTEVKSLKDSNASLTEEITRLQQLLTETKTEGKEPVDYEKMEEILSGRLSLLEEEAYTALQALENTLYSRISALEENGAKQLEMTEQKIGNTIDSKLNAATKLFMDEAEIISGRLNELAAKVTSLNSRIAGIEKSIAGLNNQAVDGFNQIEEQIKGIPKPEKGITGEEIREIISEEMEKLEIEKDELTKEKEAVSEQIFSLTAFRGIISGVREQFSRVVMSGFSGGQPQIGNWSKNGAALRQHDADAYFAKYVLPVPQEGRPLLYSFDAKSEGSGWVGLGLHLFAADTDKKGYGFGSSLLVWFTRDPDVYKSDRTWLELYRSNNDVDMYRVLHGGIEEPMDEFFRVEILYEPQAEYITIAVNGIDKIRFKTYFDIENGIEVSLRSLGPASFKNLSIKKMP